MIRLGILKIPKLALQHRNKTPIKPMVIKTLNLQATPTFIECVRTTTFFNKVKAEAIWKSNNTVSNAGKKRGRGKSLKGKKLFDLNKRIQFGYNKENMRWPGLNSAVMQGQDVLEVEKLLPDPEYEKKLMNATNALPKRIRKPIHPLERGWSGRSILGKSLGPPEGIEYIQSFDSYVLESKFLKLTDGKLGKVRSFSAFVVVGDGKGLIGISSAKAVDMKTAVKRAQRRALKKLFQIKLEDSHTVNHDFFYQFGITKLFVYKRSPGYGLVCNRGIAVCCKLLGIQNLYAKVEGSTNKQNVIKAFLLGLLEQKSYQQMADENKLHLVEQRQETYRFPVVKASPSEVLTKKDDSLLFTQYVMNGKLPLKREKQPVVAYYPNYGKYLKRTHYQRNHELVKRNLKVEYGSCESYLTELYPECKSPYLCQKSKQNSTEN